MRITPIQIYKYNNVQQQQLGTHDKTFQQKKQITEMPSYAYRPVFGAKDSSEKQEEKTAIRTIEKYMQEATPEFWADDKKISEAGKAFEKLAWKNSQKLVELSKYVTKDGTPFFYRVCDSLHNWYDIQLALSHHKDEYAEIFFTKGCFKDYKDLSLFQYLGSNNNPNIRKRNRYQDLLGDFKVLSPEEREKLDLKRIRDFIESIAARDDLVDIAKAQICSLQFRDNVILDNIIRDKRNKVLYSSCKNNGITMASFPPITCDNISSSQYEKNNNKKTKTSSIPIIKDDTPRTEPSSLQKNSSLSPTELNKLSKLNKDNKPKFYDMPYVSRVELLRELVNEGHAPDEVVKFLKSKPGNSQISIGYEGRVCGPWAQDLNDIFRNYPKHLADIYFSTGVYASRGKNKNLSLFINLGGFEENKNFLKIIAKDPELMNIAKYQANTLASEQTQKELLRIIEEVELEEAQAKTDEFIKDTMKKFDTDENYILEFADSIQTDENKDIYEGVINRLKQYNENLDFNLKDDLGISVIEKVLNSENDQLLDLMKNNEDLNYTPELDWAYNNIQNEEFKERVNELKLNFPDIKQVIETSSKEGLKRVENQFKSPFYDANVQGEEFAALAEKSNPEFTAYFYARYGKYLPEYAKDMVDYYLSLSRNKNNKIAHLNDDLERITRYYDRIDDELPRTTGYLDDYSINNNRDRLNYESPRNTGYNNDFGNGYPLPTF